MVTLHQRQAHGAVAGQQPFGGARASGTNDKAGSKLVFCDLYHFAQSKRIFSQSLIIVIFYGSIIDRQATCQDWHST